MPFGTLTTLLPVSSGEEVSYPDEKEKDEHNGDFDESFETSFVIYETVDRL